MCWIFLECENLYCQFRYDTRSTNWSHNCFCYKCDQKVCFQFMLMGCQLLYRYFVAKRNANIPKTRTYWWKVSYSDYAKLVLHSIMFQICLSHIRLKKLGPMSMTIRWTYINYYHRVSALFYYFYHSWPCWFYSVLSLWWHFIYLYWNNKKKWTYSHQNNLFLHRCRLVRGLAQILNNDWTIHFL